MSATALGPRTKSGAADQSNPLGAGNWTVQFTPTDITVTVPYEIYHVYLTGQVGAQFQWWIGTNPWSANLNGWFNDWDPAQPAIIEPGQTLYFYFSYAGGTTPMVTLWLRTHQ